MIQTYCLTVLEARHPKAAPLGKNHGVGWPVFPLMFAVFFLHKLGVTSCIESLKQVHF